MSEPSFEIRGENGAKLTVIATRREFPELTDFWDGNWFFATITIAAGGFRGHIQATLRSEEVLRFRQELAPLYENLTGRAHFRTIETWLSIDIEGDGKGHFTAECVADDQPGIGNRLSFAIEFDQTQIPPMVKGLDAILEAVPVMGAG